MSPHPSDPAADSPGRPEAAPEALRQQLAALAAECAELRARLACSETARTDLLAQTEHIVRLLDDARRELRALRGQR